MIKKILVLAILTLTISNVSADDQFKKGMLLHPIKIKGKQYGESGQVVNVIKGTKPLHVQVVINGKKYETYESDIIPYDLEFTPSKLYLRLSPGHLTGEQSSSSLRNHYLLAKSAYASFPTHPLSEYLYVIKCEATEQYEGFNKDGKDWTESIDCWRKYFKLFPEGALRDTVDWKYFQLLNAVYEYEGDIESIVADATKYEKYLLEHPATTVAEDIKFQLAHYYRMAYESFYYRDSSNEGKPAYSEKQAKSFLVKAQDIYNSLLQSKDIKTRERARVFLYNLKHNRRVYVNSNDW